MVYSGYPHEINQINSCWMKVHEGHSFHLSVFLSEITGHLTYQVFLQPGEICKRNE